MDIDLFIALFFSWGWIPTVVIIFVIGNAIEDCIEAKTCNKCTCHNCKNEQEDNS